MNEIQIIQQQLAQEKAHFAEIAAACSAAIDDGRLEANDELAAAFADYFGFAAKRLRIGTATVPGAGMAPARWLEFLRTLNEHSIAFFASVDQLVSRNVPVTEWRAVSRIDADTIYAERAAYKRLRMAIT